MIYWTVKLLLLKKKEGNMYGEWRTDKSTHKCIL